MFNNKGSLFNCKPDPPRFSYGNLFAQFAVSLITLSFCVFSINILDLTFKHEETAQRHNPTEVVIIFPD